MENDIHIGELIKAKFASSGLSVAEFARRLHCDRTNIYSIFKRSSIDTKLLVTISEVLEYDFIAEYRGDTSIKTDVSTFSVNIKIDGLKDTAQFEALLKVLQDWKDSDETLQP